MQSVISSAYLWLVRLLMAGLVLQFYFVGMALFGATSFELHRTLGYLIAAVVLALPIAALAGSLGRRVVALSALLVLLIAVQVMLPSLRGSVSWLAALHAVNALALLGLSAAISRSRGTAALGGDRVAGSEGQEK